MEDGGKKNKEPRIFSMPEPLRNQPATLAQEASAPLPPPEVQHVLIPVAVPVPSEAQEHGSLPKKRYGWMIASGVLTIFLVFGVGGAWWYLQEQARKDADQAEEDRLAQEKAQKEKEEEEARKAEEEKNKAPVPGTDTDSDGLTNVEELLYQTDYRAPDSDGDTFLDGNEVFHRYSPKGLAPETLLDTQTVRVFERASVPFTLYYPTSWTILSRNEGSPIIFRAQNDDTATWTFEAKDPLVHLKSWMKQKEITLQGEEGMTKEGYITITGNDRRTVIIDLGAYALTATYELGENIKTIEFLQTFMMMVNSVTLVP